MFVNLGTFTLLIEAGMNKFIASPVAIELSMNVDSLWQDHRESTFIDETNIFVNTKEEDISS